MVDIEGKDIGEIKNIYLGAKEKYDLPEWNLLEEEFDISKAFTGDGGIVLRDIRRKMSEKIASYLHLLETFINPQATPLFLMNVLKNLNETDWEIVRKMYKRLAKLQFQNIIADTIYSEEKEAEIIKKIYTLWNDEKHEIVKVIQILDRNYTENLSEKNKSYFG